MKVEFKESVVDLGTIGKNSSQQVFFPFKEPGKETSEKIKNVKPSCGCTADVVITEEGIKATYYDQTSFTEKQKSSGKLKEITKNLVVTFKDGEPRLIKNERDVWVKNPKKESVVLFIHAKVSP